VRPHQSHKAPQNTLIFNPMWKRISQPTCPHREWMAHSERPISSHNKIPSTCRGSEMKQRKKITRVPNMQNLKQKRQMSCQRNTDNSRRKMRNMLPTRDIMNITQTRIKRNVKSPLWCRVNSWENNITVINITSDTTSFFLTPKRVYLACGLTDLKTE
jgi:hypothetical protein